MLLSKAFIGQKAEELNFNRDTLEKVVRLTEILNFLNTDTLMKDCLALKGGTAINLTIFDLPRLSVDIDLDFTQNIGREEMLNVRESLKTTLQKYMNANGYDLSPKSKFPHALDSFVFSYTNCGSVKDNIKVEINYSLRAHILPVERVKADVLGQTVEVRRLAKTTAVPWLTLWKWASCIQARTKRKSRPNNCRRSSVMSTKRFSLPPVPTPFRKRQPRTPPLLNADTSAML